jgi:hypothetical protein
MRSHRLRFREYQEVEVEVEVCGVLYRLARERGCLGRGGLARVRQGRVRQGHDLQGHGLRGHVHLGHQGFQLVTHQGLQSVKVDVVQYHWKIHRVGDVRVLSQACVHTQEYQEVHGIQECQEVREDAFHLSEGHDHQGHDHQVHDHQVHGHLVHVLLPSQVHFHTLLHHPVVDQVVQVIHQAYATLSNHIPLPYAQRDDFRMSASCNLDTTSHLHTNR